MYIYVCIYVYVHIYVLTKVYIYNVPAHRERALGCAHHRRGRRSIHISRLGNDEGRAAAERAVTPL